MDEIVLASQSVAVVLPAAGKSRRFGGPRKKIFASLAGQPVWWHSAARLRKCLEVGRIAIAINEDDRPIWEGEFGQQLGDLEIELVTGGVERYDSVRNAVNSIGESDFVAIHDAARPLVSHDDLRRLFAAAAVHDAVVLATPVHSTIKRANDQGGVRATVDRNSLWEALTPQMFRSEVLRRAYQRWQGRPVTDDANLVEYAGIEVQLVEGSPTNLKITTADDLVIAEAIMASQSGQSGY